MSERSAFSLQAWSPERSAAWDEALSRMAQANFLHSRRFLSYHGSKFLERSLAAVGPKDQIRAILPAASLEGSTETVISHPGITHAGFLHDASMRADEASDIFDAICSHYRGLGVSKLVVKLVPPHLQRVATGLDLWLAWKAGAEIVRSDLWNVVDLRHEIRLSKGCKWSIGKAQKSGVLLRDGIAEDLPAFHAMLTASLAARHATQPVHSLEDLKQLWSLFPNEIRLRLAMSASGELVGGTLIFLFRPHCWHTQYIAASDGGRELFALNLLLDDAIRRAVEDRATCFSFGASTEDAGRRLNAGLFNFKAGFGSGSAVALHLAIKLA